MSVTFDELLRAARAGLIAVTGETAGYLVLAVTDGPGGPPLALSPAATRLSEDGSVALDSTDALPAMPLRALLAELLGFCRPAPPALARVAAATGPRLVVEVEAALIPVNRAAGRRALARLHRDVLRARVSGKLDVASAGPRVAAEPAPPPPVVVESAPVVAAPDVPAAQPPAPVAEQPPPPVSEEPAAAVATARAPLPMPTPTPALGGVNVFSEAATPIVSIEVEPAMPSSSPRLEAAPPLPSLAAFPYEPEKTPFLGSWPGALPVRTSFRDLTSAPTEHDTERAPPVAFDEPAEDAAALGAKDGAEPALRRPAAIDVEERNQVAEVAEISAPDEWVAVLSGDERSAHDAAAPSEPAAPEAAAPGEPEQERPSEPVVLEAAAPSRPSGGPLVELADPMPEVAPELADPMPEVAPELAEGSEASAEAEAAPGAPAVPGGCCEAPPEVVPEARIEVGPEKTDTEPPLVRYQPRKSDVAELLAGFGVTEDRSLREISRELKQIADVAATPSPPRVFVPAARTGLPERAVPGRPR